MPTKEEAVQALRLRNGYMATTGRLRLACLAQVEAVWSASPGYRDTDMKVLLDRLVPLVEAGELQIANLTAAFLGQQAALLRGIPVQPARVDRKEILDTRGVATRPLLQRSAVTLYTALKAGKNFKDAKTEGLNRLLSLTSSQLQLAKTTQAQKSLQASGAVYFRRVLSGSENCKICVLAATQRYSVVKRAAIHPGCDCGVEELPANEAPDKIIDRALLDAVNNLKDADGKPLDPKDQITIQEHGEMGPVLTWRKHEFTGPAALEDL